MDITKLQELIDSASKNETVLNAARKNVAKIAGLMEELNEILDPSYKPEPKERKPRAEGTKKVGRPKKQATPAE
ncbi:hypothetical protein MUN82_01835 [Hymenobacter aerilatus]|uniref:Uncharacterized protein n=1 Tax=Hymenobacter aerilatus TaxID=2932251 RepID=A0A8T9SWS2_9BACT|nr:hypothetical protein [Hymenobacter aerilatus]UOR05851.1 hypothetical protein MUN82_01835 [Hymenobacter aerilatus]